MITNKGGRPTVITAAVKERIIELAGLGVPFSKIAPALRISYQSLQNYRHANPEFEAEIECAISDAIERNLKLIRRAADTGDLRAAIWYLEKCHPTLYARNRIELSGADGAPLAGQIQILLPAKDATPSPALPVGEPVKQLEESSEDQNP